MSIWKITTGPGSALLYKDDTCAGKLSPGMKLEIAQALNETEMLREDYKKLKTQLRLCEEHAATMAKDFDDSLAVVRSDRDNIRAVWAAQRGRILEAMGSENPRVEMLRKAIEG